MPVYNFKGADGAVLTKLLLNGEPTVDAIGTPRAVTDKRADAKTGDLVDTEITYHTFSVKVNGVPQLEVEATDVITTVELDAPVVGNE